MVLRRRLQGRRMHVHSWLSLVMGDGIDRTKKRTKSTEDDDDMRYAICDMRYTIYDRLYTMQHREYAHTEVGRYRWTRWIDGLPRNVRCPIQRARDDG